MSIAAACAGFLVWQTDIPRMTAVPLSTLFAVLSLLGPCVVFGLQIGIVLWIGAAGLGGLIAAVILARAPMQRRGLFALTVLIAVAGAWRPALEAIS